MIDLFGLPDHIILKLSGSHNLDIATAAAEELDRRLPEPLPAQYDSEGNEIKSEEIGDGIWLDM